MKMAKFTTMAFMLLLFVGCTNNDEIIGSWTELIPGQAEGQSGVQGVNIELNGKASSINMATLVYESWSRIGDSLLLSGKSIGNGQTLTFTDTLKIERISADSLILKRGTYDISYARLK